MRGKMHALRAAFGSGWMRPDLVIDNGLVNYPFRLGQDWDRACAVALLQSAGWSDDHIHWWIGKCRGLPVVVKMS